MLVFYEVREIKTDLLVKVFRNRANAMQYIRKHGSDNYRMNRVDYAEDDENEE